MARLARVVAVDIPHHVTLRGNAHRFILEFDSDKLVYLDHLQPEKQPCVAVRLGQIGTTLRSGVG